MREGSHGAFFRGLGASMIGTSFLLPSVCQELCYMLVGITQSDTLLLYKRYTLQLSGIQSSKIALHRQVARPLSTV